ncbi:MAG TPA: AAA family ATPase, partial [Alphaproteobacteria bacterium]|nr:AAA family ATPase [Alphaproteobacteria bacterium]
MTNSSASPSLAAALKRGVADVDARGGVFPACLSVARLSLTNFRCYAQLRLEVGPGPVVLTGPNGAGKTNLLEALSFLSPGRGLRRARLAEPDRRTHDGATVGRWAVSTVLSAADGPLAIGTGHDAGDDQSDSPRRVVRIDGAPGSSQSELALKLSVVWLTPDMDRLFEDSASERRRFLDRLVYAFDPAQAGRVAAYEHRMRERARLLAEGRGDPAWLDALEDGMAAHGVAIAAARAGTAARLDRACAQALGPFPQARLAVAGEIDAWLADGPALAA